MGFIAFSILATFHTGYKMAIQRTDNFLLGSNFIMSCSDFPVMSSLATTVDFPSITLGEVDLAHGFSDIKAPGEKLSYTEIEVSFLIDENLDSWMEVYNFMEKTAGNNVQERDRSALYTDITVTVLTNKKNSTGRLFTFQDAFPVSLSPLPFDSQTSSTDPIICVASFAISNIKVENTDLDVSNFTRWTYKQFIA